MPKLDFFFFFEYKLIAVITIIKESNIFLKIIYKFLIILLLNRELIGIAPCGEFLTELP